jgi:hypothetical protein
VTTFIQSAASSNPVLPAVSGVGQIVNDLTTKVTGAPQEPSDALKDLRLSQSLIDLFTPPLQALGYTIENQQLTEKYTDLVHSYTAVRNNASRRLLFHIPMWILDDASPANTSAVIAMGYWLERGTTLIILSEGLDTPARPYRKVAEEAWSKLNGLKASFIPWRDITDIKSKNLDELKLRLTDILQLEAMESAAAPQPSSELVLNGSQLEQLQKAMLSAFENEAKLKQMVFFKFDLELSTVAGGENFSDIVFNLIRWAAKQGCLGKLVKESCAFVPENPDLKNFVQQIGLP